MRLLMDGYGNGEQENLSANDRKLLKALAERYKQEIVQRKQ